MEHRKITEFIIKAIGFGYFLSIIGYLIGTIIYNFKGNPIKAVFWSLDSAILWPRNLFVKEMIKYNILPVATFILGFIVSINRNVNEYNENKDKVYQYETILGKIINLFVIEEKKGEVKKPIEEKERKTIEIEVNKKQDGSDFY